MADQVLRELEAAAQVLLAPPNLVTSEQRHSAEAVFLNFQKTKSPYQLCQEILETSTVPYVLFESTGVIKTALVREWVLLQKSDIQSLRQYLLRYIISKPTLAPFVRERILQVIAIMVKRGSVEDLGEERKELLNEVEGLILSGEMPRQLLGCSIISALMQEYATTVKSSDIGLTWEIHFKAKKNFEVISLKRIFKFCVQILEELVCQKADIPEPTLPLIKHLLAICENVLVWGFIYACNLPRRLISVFEGYHESETNPTLHLTSMWRDAILDPAVIQLFFTIYWKIRSNPQLAHHARTCLVQLASLNGGIVQNDDVKLQYLTTYMESFLKLLSSIEVIDQEALGMASVFKKLVTYFQSTITNLPMDIQRSFMEHMTRLTCLFAEGASQEESMCVDDCLYMDAFAAMLDTWITVVLSDSSVFPSDFCQNSSIQIFNTYLKCHLSPPDGTRGAGSKELDHEEIDATEEDDRSKFKEQLQIIGSFGRQVLNHSLPLLSRLLEDRTNKLKDHLNRLVGQPGSPNISDLASVENLYEDLHWLVLITGHVLCMESDGEAPLVPSQIMCYSMEQVQQGQMDLNVTLQLLASPQSNLSDINGAEQSADHVIRLIAAVFRLSEVAKIVISFNAAEHLSPELCSSIIWFMNRWSLNYLILKEVEYAELSTTLLQAFGEDTPGCQWCVNFVLDKIQCKIKAFKSEPALIKETIDLLITFLHPNCKADCLVKSDQFGNLVELATKSRDLPQVAKRGLMRVITQAGSGITDKDRQLQYYNQILQPLDTNFKEIVFNPNFQSNYHQEEIKAQLMEILDSLIGVTKGVDMHISEKVFNYIGNILTELPRLLTLYHNYQQIVQLILELFHESSKSVLHFLDNPSRLFDLHLHMLQAYANCNRTRLSTDATAEEDAFQDILLILQAQTNLLTTYVLGPNLSSESGQTENQQLSPVNVFLYGLNVIMPMMTMNLLKFPSLCLQYYKMITFMCEIHPETVCALPADMLRQLLISVELGLFSFGHEVTTHCLDIIQVMAKHIFMESEKGAPKNQLMAPFLNLLMNLIITHQINSDVISNASMPLYYLILCYKEQYDQLVQTLISEQPDPTTAQRLAAAFDKLSKNCEELSSPEYWHRFKFRDSFDKFIVNVQGFLIVK